MDVLRNKVEAFLSTRVFLVIVVIVCIQKQTSTKDLHDKTFDRMTNSCYHRRPEQHGNWYNRKKLADTTLSHVKGVLNREGTVNKPYT